MGSKCALYVDAGYLLAAAATRVTGTSLRNGCHVEFGPLIDGLVEQAEAESGLSVLRLHWYDSAKDRVPNLQQQRIGERSRVKLRLGHFGVDGQQKGVDLRIGLDLVTHARNRVADIFYLVSGDDDLTEAVEEAQVHGVQVVILAVPSADAKAHGVSRHLVRAADGMVLVTGSTIDDSVWKVEQSTAAAAEHQSVPGAGSTADKRVVPSPLDLAGKPKPTTPAAPALPVAATPPSSVLAYTGRTGAHSHVLPGYESAEDYDEQIDSVVSKVLTSYRLSATPGDIAAIGRGRPSIPRDIDRALLLDLCEVLDIYDLSDVLRFRIRARFWEMFEQST